VEENLQFNRDSQFFYNTCASIVSLRFLAHSSFGSQYALAAYTCTTSLSHFAIAFASSPKFESISKGGKTTVQHHCMSIGFCQFQDCENRKVARFIYWMEHELLLVGWHKFIMVSQSVLSNFTFWSFSYKLIPTCSVCSDMYSCALLCWELNPFLEPVSCGCSVGLCDLHWVGFCSKPSDMVFAINTSISST